MLFFNILIIKNGNIFTYSSFRKLEIGQYVQIKIRNRIFCGIVFKEIQADEVNFPLEKVKNIVKATKYFLPKEHLETLIFAKNWHFINFRSAFQFAKPHRKIKTKNNISKHFNNFPIKLSESQNKAFKELKEHQISLLFGDTGTGKTEIYQKLIFENLQKNLDSIILVPEINIIPQLQIRFKKIFGDLVEGWHAKLTKKTRQKVLKNIYLGKTKIIIGTAGSVFLPFQNLGLIIIDEEHSDSFNFLNINIKNLAIFLASKLKIRVVLGSATPTVRSYYKFPVIRLKEKYHQTSSKKFLIDTKYGLHKNLINKIKDNWEKQNQTIVFVPIRSNFKYLQCKNCQKIEVCPYCSIHLSVYFQKGIMKCNKCGYKTVIPQVCNQCQAPELSVSVFGTLQIAEELKIALPELNIEVFDTDNIKNLTKLNKIVKDFQNKKIDLLVGTQMLSKGHDFPNLTLAIILGTDFMFNINDFQSYEKTLSLVTQIAGRSGRKDEGTIILQTKNKDFYKEFIKDYELFLKFELNNRQITNFPPFSTFVRFLIEDKSKDWAFEQVKKLADFVQKNDFEIINYGEAPISKIENKYRFHLILRTDLHWQKLIKLFQPFQKDFKIEINPNNFS